MMRFVRPTFFFLLGAAFVLLALPAFAVAASAESSELDREIRAAESQIKAFTVVRPAASAKEHLMRTSASGAYEQIQTARTKMKSRRCSSDLARGACEARVDRAYLVSLQRLLAQL